jgi:hypothetical protein
MTRSSRLFSASAGMLALLASTAAEAHLLITGMGPIYDGVAHFALSPEDFLPVVALAFFAGLRGPCCARVLSWTIPLAWIMGGILAMMTFTAPDITLSATTAALFLLIGGLLAANPPLSVMACAGLGALLGIVRGMVDLANAQEGASGGLMLLGIAGTTFVTFAIATSVTLALKRLWLTVAARVCGSWLAALGLLLAGWILRYGPVVR